MAKANKFYYNGELVRTSKTHEYHFGIFNGKTIRSCHGTKENAEKELHRLQNDPLNWIENNKKAIKALESGKSYYYYKDGRHEFRHKFDSEDTVEAYQKCIEANKALHEKYLAYKIVELEMR